MVLHTSVHVLLGLADCKVFNLLTMKFMNSLTVFCKILKFSQANDARAFLLLSSVFFASVEKFTTSFNFKEVISEVTIDLNRAHFWDLSAVAAMDKVVLKFRREGTKVNIVGLNKASETIIDKFRTYDKENINITPVKNS